MCSFYTKGTISYDVAITIDSVVKELQRNFTAAVFEASEFNTLITEQFDVNTGWIETKAEAESMLEFFASEYKYLYDAINDSRVAIIVDTKNIAVWKSTDGKYQFQFKYKYAQNSTVTTPLLIE
jgi:hypothetical protein